MRSGLPTFIALLSFLPGNGAGLHAAEAHSSAPHSSPLQVTLDIPLDTRKTASGSPVYASVAVPWAGPDCTLAVGATVYGRALAVSQKGSNGSTESRLTLLFDSADCNGRRQVPVPLLVYAISDNTDDMERTGMRDRMGLFGQTQAHPMMGLGGGSATPMPVSNNERALADTNGSMRSVSSPAVIKAGQVLGIGKATLDVGSGEDGGSILHAPAKFLHLNSKAQIVLLPVPARHESAVLHPSTERPVTEAPEVRTPPPPPPPIDETDVCTSDCNVAGSTPDLALSGATAISLRRLSFVPRTHAELYGFDNDSTLTYLSPGELLVTFDPHRLRQHSGSELNPSTRREIRAVLLDPQTGKILRALDWNVDGDGAYLWPAGPGHILLHRDGQLVEMTAGLKPIASIPAQGDIRWLSVSPSGNHIAFGLFRERHTRAVHNHIAALAGPPEEDVEVTLVDAHRRIIGSTLVSDRLPRPVLSDGGQLVATPARNGQWKVSEQVWDGGSRPIATLSSTCTPELSAPDASVLLVRGCAATATSAWYRLLRASDGHTLLKSVPNSRQMEVAAIGSLDGSIAVRSVALARSVDFHGSVKRDDLREEVIDLYAAHGAQHVLRATASTYAQSTGNFALSPDGAHLALLTDSGVTLYAAPR